MEAGKVNVRIVAEADAKKLGKKEKGDEIGNSEKEETDV